MATHETTTVSSTAVTQLANAGKAGQAGYTRAFIQVLDAAISFRTDGTDPTASSDVIVLPGGTITLNSPEDIRNFKAIAIDADATLSVIYGLTVQVEQADIVLAGIANSGVPTEVSNGNRVRLWLDDIGRPVVKGYNFSQDAMNVVEQAPPECQTMEFIDTPLLDAVTAAGASFSVEGPPYNKFGFQIIASGVSSGATIDIEASHDGNSWPPIASKSITANGATDVQVSGAYKYLRANVSSYNDGTYTVTLLAKV